MMFVNQLSIENAKQPHNGGAGRDRSPAPVGDVAQSALVCLKAANQYTTVMTRDGEHLLRGTLQDTIDRLQAEAGVRIHRSWWISAGEFASAKIDTRARTLVTRDGVSYPIGRTRLQDVKQAMAGFAQDAVDTQKPVAANENGAARAGSGRTSIDRDPEMRA